MLPLSTECNWMFSTNYKKIKNKKVEGKEKWLRAGCGPRLCVFMVRPRARHTLMQNLILATPTPPPSPLPSFWQDSEAPQKQIMHLKYMTCAQRTLEQIDSAIMHRKCRQVCG